MDERVLLSLGRNPNVYITVLASVISLIVAGMLTYACALIAEHEPGYANSLMMFTSYVFLALASTWKEFSEHRFFFMLVALWLFYRNLGFEYDEWPDAESQQLRSKYNTVLGGAALCLCMLLCLNAEHRLRFGAVVLLLGIASLLQRNPGNNDEEWAQTANLAVFCFLYATSFFVFRLQSKETDIVAAQSLWALQTNDWRLLVFGMLLQLCVYVYLLFAHAKMHEQ